jgi:hypothetical protein
MTSALLDRRRHSSAVEQLFRKQQVFGPPQAVTSAVLSAPSIGIRIFVVSARLNPVGRPSTDVLFEHVDIIAVTVAGGRIELIDMLADPDRLSRLVLTWSRTEAPSRLCVSVGRRTPPATVRRSACPSLHRGSDRSGRGHRHDAGGAVDRDRLASHDPRGRAGDTHDRGDPVLAGDHGAVRHHPAHLHH